MMLECRSLTKEYRRGVKALDSLSARFTNGIYGILGPNGAGKSTMINIIARLLDETSGQVCWDGKDVCSLDAEYRKLIGYLPQNPPVYPWMSARRFLTYMSDIKEIPEDRRNIDEMLADVELADRADDKIRNYSGGMKQRLGIAQALLGRPKILLLDEPTAGLDPRQRAVFKSMLRVRAKDTIILLCTHIVSDLADIADEILMMRDGKLLGMLPPEEWLNRLNGRVWWVKEDDDMLERYPTAMRCLYNGQSGLRIITAQPPEGAAALEMTLEDIYLQCYTETGIHE